MRVLLDENVPRKLRRAFGPEFEVTTVQAHGWAGVLNGDLLNRANAEFDAFITLDRGIEDQQDLTGLSIRIVIVRAFSNTLRELLPFVPSTEEALKQAAPGTLTHVAG